MKELLFPLFQLLVNEDDETGVSFVSLVENPAIKIDWVAFAETKNHQFKIVDEDKQIITGPLMLADTPIIREDADIGKFYVYFDAPSIERMVQKYFKDKNVDQVNQEHSVSVEGVTMMESWLVRNPQKDKSADFGFELPTGSWMGSFYVENDKVWADIKNGSFKGFSIEGQFLQKYEKQIKEKMIALSADDEVNAVYEAVVETIEGEGTPEEIVDKLTELLKKEK